MKEKEAIERIRDHNRIHSKKEPYTPLLNEAMCMAIDALEKQLTNLSESEENRNNSEHDACKGCKYEEKDFGEYPCYECKGCYRDMWRCK